MQQELYSAEDVWFQNTGNHKLYGDTAVLTNLDTNHWRSHTSAIPIMDFVSDGVDADGAQLYKTIFHHPVEQNLTELNIN